MTFQNQFVQILQFNLQTRNPKHNLKPLYTYFQGCVFVCVCMAEEGSAGRRDLLNTQETIMSSIVFTRNEDDNPFGRRTYIHHHRSISVSGSAGSREILPFAQIYAESHLPATGPANCSKINANNNPKYISPAISMFIVRRRSNSLTFCSETILSIYVFLMS